MKKLFLLIPMFMFFLVGCSTTSMGPREYGNATGVAVYIGYNSIAAKQDPAFRENAEKLWETIQLIDSYDDLAESVDDMTKMFDACINSSSLTAEEKVLCILLKKRITDKVGQVLANKLETNENATEFLLGVREGIAEMAAISPAPQPQTK